jgi:glycosyltransferase involved in cell wall biosynthesis
VAILGSRGYPSTYGGFETLVRRLAPYLRDEGIDTTVYCRDSGYRRFEAVVDGIRCLHTPGIELKSLSTLSHGLTATADAIFRRFDAILAVNVANGLYVPIIRAARVPVAVNVDGIEWERAKWGTFARTMFLLGARLTARFSDEIVVDSRAIGRTWDCTFGREGVFIPYGADEVGPRSTARIEAMGLKRRSYALIVARLVPENSIELLLDALDLSGDLDRTVVVGGANYRSPIEARLEALRSARTGFQWLGHVDDQELLTDLWAHCGVYLHGHSVGGTNPALLQALAAGSPSLALDTPYNKEVLESDEQLFHADPVDLAGDIQRVLTDPGRQEALSTRGRELVASRYRWDAVCEKYTALLRTLIEGGRTRA